MKDYWFVPKKYGYGAYPANWKGWVAVIVFIGVFVLHATHFPTNYLGFVLLILLVILISKRKTKGTWQWRWG